nr:hypothetical protein [Tanacetum cinerariifolium]
MRGADTCLHLRRLGLALESGDPLPSDDIVDLELLDKLDNIRTLIRKYSETFLCLVSLSRSLTDPTSRPALLCRDKNMGLLDFVKSLDPSKVKTGERTLAPNKVPLLTETADVFVNPSPQIIRLVTHTIADEIDLHLGKNKRKVGASFVPPPVKKAKTGRVSIKEPAVTTAGKSPAVIKKLIKQANVDDESVLNHEDNVRTCPPGRYVVLSSSSTDTDNLNSSQVIPSASYVQANIDVVATKPSGVTNDSSAPVIEVRGSSVPENETGTSSTAPSRGSPIDDFYDSQTIDSATTQNIYVPNWDVTNIARMDDPIMCRNLVDRVPPPGYRDFLCNLNDAEFLDRAKDEVAGVVEVCKKVSKLETVAVAKTEELASFSVQNADLTGQARYEEAVKELENILLPFLARLESYKDVPLECIMASLYLEGFTSPEDETPNFHKLQPVLEQVTVTLYYEHEDQGISAPHDTDVPPVNSIAVKDYTLFDVSMLKTTAKFGPPNPFFVNDQSEVAHDEMFDTTLLDKPMDP